MFHLIYLLKDLTLRLGVQTYAGHAHEFIALHVIK